MVNSIHQSNALPMLKTATSVANAITFRICTAVVTNTHSPDPMAIPNVLISHKTMISGQFDGWDGSYSGGYHRSKWETFEKQSYDSVQITNTDTKIFNDQSTLFSHSMHVGEAVHVGTARKHSYAKLQTSSHNVKNKISYKIDTGADGKLLTIRVYQQFFPHVIQSARALQETTNFCQGLCWVWNQAIRYMSVEASFQEQIFCLYILYCRMWKSLDWSTRQRSCALSNFTVTVYLVKSFHFFMLQKVSRLTQRQVHVNRQDLWTILTRPNLLLILTKTL